MNSLQATSPSTSPELCCTTNAATAFSTCTKTKTAHPQRKAGSLLQKCILAGPAIYLDLSVQNQESYTGLLKGKILACPKPSKNEFHYTLKWYSFVTDKNEKLNASHFQNSFPHGLNNLTQLLDAKDVYNLSETHNQSKPSASTNTVTTSSSTDSNFS